MSVSVRKASVKSRGFVVILAIVFIVGIGVSGASHHTDCSQSSGFYSAPDTVAMMTLNSEFFLKNGMTCKLVARYGSQSAEVTEFRVDFSSPVSFQQGVEWMPFPPLLKPPFESGVNRSAAKQHTFTIFIVKMLTADNWSHWKTEAIRAYKPGRIPTVACMRAYRPYRSAAVAVSSF